jgi:hypothetical protein
MNREEIINSLQELPTETNVQSWLFQIGKDYYQISTYGGRYRIPEASGIWKSNKRGKRLTADEFFKTPGKDHLKCLNKYLDHLEAEEEMRMLEDMNNSVDENAQ